MTISSPVFAGNGRTVPLAVVRSPRARGMRLRVDPRDGIVRLSLPPRASLKHGLAWVESKRGFIEAALARLPAPSPLDTGLAFMLAGKPVVLDWSPAHPRKPRLADGMLRIGGPREGLGARLVRHLRAEAQILLDAETRALAAAHGIAIGRVSVADTRSRWGSCAHSGDIRYCWRLILAPDFVRRSVVAHEVAHRLHMNHGPAFHRAAAELLGGSHGPANRWLRANGAALHWFGRDG